MRVVTDESSDGVPSPVTDSDELPRRKRRKKKRRRKRGKKRRNTEQQSRAAAAAPAQSATGGPSARWWQVVMAGTVVLWAIFLIPETVMTVQNIPLYVGLLPLSVAFGMVFGTAVSDMRMSFKNLPQMAAWVFIALLLTFPAVLLPEKLNAFLDLSAAKTHEVRVIDLGMRDPEGSETWVVVTSWRKPGESLSFNATDDLHRQLAVNSKMLVSVREGRFGWPWIESAKVMPPKTPSIADEISERLEQHRLRQQPQTPTLPGAEQTE